MVLVWCVGHADPHHPWPAFISSAASSEVSLTATSHTQDGSDSDVLVHHVSRTIAVTIHLCRIHRVNGYLEAVSPESRLGRSGPTSSPLSRVSRFVFPQRAVLVIA